MLFFLYFMRFYAASSGDFDNNLKYKNYFKRKDRYTKEYCCTRNRQPYLYDLAGHGFRKTGHEVCPPFKTTQPTSIYNVSADQGCPQCPVKHPPYLYRHC